MQSKTLPPVGTALAGGFYASRIRIADAIFALIVAPKADGETTAEWIHDDVDVPAARSWFDGMANTIAMAEAGSKLANWARGLQIGGFTDWCIPARDQLEVLYRAFKPTAQDNYEYRSGDNPSSLPAGYPYTATEPVQTSVAAFQQGGAEAFEPGWYWTSTQISDSGDAWCQHFYGGFQDYDDESHEGRARAVRLIQLTD